MLEGLRVLDLSDERGLLAGRLLADLGADVVRVEPPGGSAARRAQPVDPASGQSLTWATFAAGSRSVQLDPDDAHWRLLLDRADVLITSQPATELARWGLDRQRLAQDRPRLIWAAVTAFGFDGPKAGYADSDLIVWAAGGPLAPHRDGDLPPLRISVPQAFLHAGADAATGVLLALLERDHSGLGQFVDVSAQVSVGQATLARILAHAVGDDNPEWQTQPKARTDQSGSGAATPNSLKKWQAADGMIDLHLSMGPAAGGFTNNLFAWLNDEGAVPQDIAAWDWRTVPTRIYEGDLDPADLDRARAAVRAFLRTKSKWEVVQAAVQRRMLSMAIFDMADVAGSPHLAARGFFTEVEIAGKKVPIPGRFATVTGIPGPQIRGRAPELDEHHAQVLAEWDVEAEPKASGPRKDPLAGITVLDLSWVVAGPLMGRTLADFGATVIRVESSSRIETARLMQPFHGGKPDREGSALFANCNAGKLGMTLDLKSAEGRQIVLDLAARADVVVESFSPGQMARWGLDYATLAEANPDLIMVSSSICGQNGPWSALAGFGNVGSSLSGFQNLVGWPDRVPMGPFGPYTDYVGPRIGLVALLGALYQRERTGRGCHIDVSQVESGVFFLSPQVAQVGVDGTVAGRRGNDDAVFAPHGVYPAASEDGRERFVAIAVTTDAQWAALARAIGRPDLGGDPRLSTAGGRREHRQRLDQLLTEWTSSRSARRVEEELQAAGVPAHQAHDPYSYVRDEQLLHRGHLVTLPHPLFGTTVAEGARVALSATPGRPRAAAPQLGQHNDDVLVGILHRDPADVEHLRTEGVLR